MIATEHRSTSRVLSILKVLSTEHEGLSMAELAHTLNAPKSSLFPIIHTMAIKNFISYNDATQKYTIGLNSYLTGISYLKKHNVLESIKGEMKLIVGQCSETCQFGILEDSQILYLAKVDSPEPVRLISDIGKRLPAYCTGIGKALLSECSIDDLKRLYTNQLTPLTNNTVKNIDDLYVELQNIKKTSIASEKGESHPDISCVATPLMREGVTVAAISVSVPSFRFTPEKRKQIEQILLTSKSKFEDLLKQNDLIR